MREDHRQAPRSSDTGSQAHVQIPGTGPSATPAAAVRPPTNGATEGACSRFTTVDQTIHALYAMKAPPSFAELAGQKTFGGECPLNFRSKLDRLYPGTTESSTDYR